MNRELADELRRFNGLGASSFRAAAARLEMPATDVQAVDLLASSGPATPGQLADHVGLTTGAVTGMLKRLEDAGLVRRDADPRDARRVIVSLEPNSKRLRDVERTLHAMSEAWAQAAAALDEAQAAALLEFLKRCNDLSRGAVLRLRELPFPGDETSSAPIAGARSGSLSVAGAYHLRLAADRASNELYSATFDGPVPNVTSGEGSVAVRYPRRLLLGPMGRMAADITLNAHIPWRITIRGAAAMIEADLRGLNLAELEIRGAASSIDLRLPRCTAVVPIRMSGGASAIRIRREPSAAAEVHLKGWASTLELDGTKSSNVGNNVWLQSDDYEPSGPGYAIELASSASSVTIERDAEPAPP